MSKIKALINQYKSINVQAKSAMWYTVCNLLQNGISFLTIPIYTRILTTAEYGQYTVFQSWKDILLIFATLNLYCGVFTKAMVDHDDDRDRYTSSIQGLSTLITGALFALYVIKYELWNRLLSMDTITVLMLFVFFICYPAYNFWAVRQRVQYKYVAMVVVTLLLSVATPAISLYLLFFTDLRANAIIWGYMLVQIAFGGFFYIYQFVKGKTFYVKEYWSHALKFNIPLIPHYLSIMILGQADRIMIKEICGEDKAGIYSLAYQVAMMMNIVVSAINGSLVPWTYESLKNRNYKAIGKTATLLCVLMGVMTLAVAMISPEVIWILGSEKYMEAKWIIPVVALSVYFTFCYNLFSNIEFYYGETKFVMVASTTGAILNVVLNAICIPLFGYIAAGYTTLVCYIFFAFMHYMFTRRICKKYIDGEQIYDISKMLLISAGLIVGTIICMVLYNYTVVRYGVILVAALVCLLNIKKILGILGGLKS